MTIIKTGKSVSGGVIFNYLAFCVENGAIKKVCKECDTNINAIDVIDLRGLTVMPGFIDSHVHGGAGFDTMDGTYDALNGMSLHKIKEGVTSFVPATVTASDELTKKALGGVREAVQKGVEGAKIAGLFLEGPYINPKNKGAHPLEYIKPICAPDMKALAEDARAALGEERVVCFAVAPEMAGAFEAIAALREMGVNVRIGHSSATLDQANAGAKAGANSAIHTYNAMSALNHREPGMVGAALTNDSIFAEIICDLVHVHPDAIKIIAKMKGPDKTVLITDCMCAGGLQDGEYTLGELPVIVKDNVARLKDGALAGSTAALSVCVRNMRDAVGVPLAEAVSMATAAPAKQLGLFDSIGSLDEGKRADIIAADDSLNIKFVMVEGVVKLNCL